MSWLNTPIPIWQLLVLITIYVLYKELLKIILKHLIRKWRSRNDPPRQVLEKPEDVHT